MIMHNQDGRTALHNQAGWTALFYAAGEGYTAVVTVLLDRGADITATGNVIE